MGGLFGGGKKKTKVAPPSYAQPYLKQGLSESQRLYGQGNPVVPFSQDSTAAQNMVRDRATGGDPTINAATGYVQNSLNGGFLNANPYIDATFNKAAQATQGQLASQFAGSGRNVNQSEGLRAQQLNDLATSIYGGNYANERQLMQGTLPYAQQLGNQAYTDAGALSASGAQQEQKAQDVADAPFKSLDDYLQRIGSIKYGSETTDTEKADPLTSIAGGLTTLSGMFGGGGTAAGSQLGGLLGGGGSAATYPGINGAVSIPSAGGLFGSGGGLGGAGFGGAAALGSVGAPMGGIAGGSLASLGGTTAANAGLMGAAESGMASASAALGGASGGGGLMSGLAAAAPWAAAALAAGAVIAKNLPDKSKYHDDLKFQPDGSVMLTTQFPGKGVSTQDVNAFYGPVLNEFARTGNLEQAMAKMPAPATPAQQFLADPKQVIQLFKGTGNPFRNIAMKKGFGQGPWSEGNKSVIPGLNTTRNGKAGKTGLFGSVAIPRQVAGAY